MPIIDEVAAILQRGLPHALSGGAISLWQCSAPVHAEDDQLIVELCVDLHDTDGTVRDRKSQGVHFLPATRYADPRCLAYTRGWLRALPPRLVATNSSDLDHLMPHTLVYPEALEDPALQNDADFERAFSSPEQVRAWWANGG